MPFFHLEEVLGYWAFGPIASILWASADNTLNTVTNLHMLFMSYSRLRSILSPKQYTEELLLKRPWLTIVCFWVFGVSYWTICCFIFKSIRFASHINYHPHYLQSILNFFVWLLPLTIVLILSIYLLFLLKNRVRRKSSRKKSAAKKEDQN